LLVKVLRRSGLRRVIPVSKDAEAAPEGTFNSDPPEPVVDFSDQTSGPGAALQKDAQTDCGCDCACDGDAHDGHLTATRYKTRPLSLWGAFLIFAFAIGLIIYGLVAGNGMSLSTVSLAYVATTAWVYRDVLEDIDRALFVEYVVNALIALAYTLVVLVAHNDKFAVWIDAVAAVSLVSFIFLHGQKDRSELKRKRQDLPCPTNRSKVIRNQ
jgi:hypothetical protein